jgi:uncharacterized protein YcaQ
MENKQTALDILFEEIKESTAVMPNALFKYFHMVYDKAKQIEKEQMAEKYDEGHADGYYSGCQDFEQYNKES